MIKQRVAAHNKWNEGWVDKTTAPLTPPSDVNITPTFRTAVTEYLPTPPASATSEHAEDATVEADLPRILKEDPVSVRYASPSYDDRFERRPSFRRRYGRGGRLFIDRRHMKSSPTPETGVVDVILLDRMKFDCDDSDEDETPVYPVNPDTVGSIWFRARANFEAERVQAMKQARLAQQQQAEGSDRAH